MRKIFPLTAAFSIVVAWLLPAALIMMLASCGGGGDADDRSPAMPALGAVTIAAPLAYLVQSAAPDGDPATPLLAADVMAYRMSDYGGYQLSDSFLRPDGSAEVTWSYPPFGPFTPANGDGGERYVLGPDGTVRIINTQDGSAPRPRYYTGQTCGGTGWVLFRTDATDAWRELVASLSVQQDAAVCAAFSRAYTRYERVAVDYPDIGAADSIVSEHYDAAGMDSASAMERSFLARGWGRRVWQSWQRGGPPVNPASRCPDFGWNTPPAAGFVLSDCRTSTRIIAPPQPIAGIQEWQP